MEPLARLSRQQGRFLGRMDALGFALREAASLGALTEEVVQSSGIEGEHLDPGQVRSSLARRLGLDAAGLPVPARHVEGVVEVLLDATQGHAAPLTAERLWAWHAALFPTGYSGMHRIQVGGWRTAASGDMQVVSGPWGRERVHFEAPEAERLEEEMATFLAWFEAPDSLEPLLKAGLAHLWFVTIHPFDDGNGRIARAIAELALARAEGSAQRFYSMSAQLRAERTNYYAALEGAQRGDLDATEWLLWFLACLSRALERAEDTLAQVLSKAHFWESARRVALNGRQVAMLNRLVDGFEGKLTSTKWAKLAKCSQDSASRDLQDLVAKGLVRREGRGSRDTHYALVFPT